MEGSNSDPFVVLSTMMGEYLRTLVVQPVSVSRQANAS